MLKVSHLGAVGLGDLGPFLHGVVGVFIDHQEVAPAHESRQRPHVGEGNRGVNEHILDAEPARQLRLGQLVGTDRTKGPRGAVVRPPQLHAAGDGFLHARVLIQAKKTVRTEIDHAPAIDFHLPMGAEMVNHQVLEKSIGILPGVKYSKKRTNPWWRKGLAKPEFCIGRVFPCLFHASFRKGRPSPD